MLRAARLLALSLLLLPGCCSTNRFWDDDGSNACATRAAAQEGWKNTKEGLRPQPHPVLHDSVLREGMQARDVIAALGAPPRKAPARPTGERWIYPGRALVVFVREGTVFKWQPHQEDASADSTSA